MFKLFYWCCIFPFKLSIKLIVFIFKCIIYLLLPSLKDGTFTASSKIKGTNLKIETKGKVH